MFQRLFARKTLEMLHEEMQADNRLRRVLGPVALTSLGVGAIIGAGIFVMTGRVAANEAGPAIVLSFAIAGVGCALAAFCYSEFASMAPVAGSAYTYAYTTLGELFAWIIGWDLILEYAMSCATVAASWSKYLNAFTSTLFGWQVPDYLCHDPFSHPGAWFNLPAVLILAVVTLILVIGIRESAASNTLLVCVKLAVVLFVIFLGAGYVSSKNWTGIPIEERKLPAEVLIDGAANAHAEAERKLQESAGGWSSLVAGGSSSLLAGGSSSLLAGESAKQEVESVAVQTSGGQDVFTPPGVDHDTRARELREMALSELNSQVNRDRSHLGLKVAQSEQDKQAAKAIVAAAEAEAPQQATRSWGLLGTLGLNKLLADVDEKTRGSYMPYGISGVMLGAAIVFFAFIGFDSISTHSEEAKRPQRDVPIGILASLFICTLLYIGVSVVITGMQPYYQIDPNAAVADAFAARAKTDQSQVLNAAAGLIAAGALAGMTSVLLITFLSQARVFLAMARDGLLPHSIFGAVHEKFKTPHISTALTGAVICIVAAFTPIDVLGEMVNIGTLFAFVVVCASVLILRIKRPDAKRPFKCPAVFLVAPAGILVNLVLMLFLPLESWIRLFAWLAAGLVIYFAYGMWRSKLYLATQEKPAPAPAKS